jgi:hypothetical protein
MRKVIFILLTLLLIKEASGKSVKIFQGLNLSRYSGTLYGENVWKFRIGFASGLGYEIDFGSHIGLEIDALFIQKGSKEEVIENGLRQYTINYTLNEINFPIFLKFKLKTDASLYFLAGSEFSIILSHNVEAVGAEISIVPPKIRRYYHGVAFGSGFGQKIKTVFPFIELQYHLGLKNILEKSEDRSYKPSAILFLLGLRF